MGGALTVFTAAPHTAQCGEAGKVSGDYCDIMKEVKNNKCKKTYQKKVPTIKTILI
jgi:hypothetical protein